MTILDGMRRAGSLAATWWLDQLEMAWPGQRLGTAPGVPPMRLVARGDDDAVSIALIDQGGRAVFTERSPWGEYDRAFFDRCLAKARPLAGPSPLVVSVGIAHAIGRTLVLPRRARAEIDEILRTHICRKTPLRIDEVFLRHVVRVMRNGRLEVRYLVAPRSLIGRVVKRLSIPLAQIATVENVPEGDAPTVIVPFAPSPRANLGWAGRLTLGLLAVIPLSLAVGFANTAVRQAVALDRIENAIAEVTANAPPPAREQQTLQGLEDALETFAELRSVPGILQVWDDLARILPKSTHLTELTVSGQTLQIAGYSSSATALIHAIEGALTIHGAVLAAPVIWAHDRQKERFSITASLRASRMATLERD